MAEQSNNVEVLRLVTEDPYKISLLQEMINKVESIENAFSLLVQDEFGFWILKIFLPGSTSNNEEPEANIEMHLLRSAIDVRECSVRTSILDDSIAFFRKWNGIVELKDKLR